MSVEPVGRPSLEPTVEVRFFGPPESWTGGDLICFGGDLTPELALRAYTEGVFPMPVRRKMGWWSPVERGVLPLDGLRVSRSLRRSLRRYRVTCDTAFDEVIRSCADPSRPGGWIDSRIMAVFTELHRRGYAHSVEAWGPGGALVGGLYGIGIGGFFAGESMFSRAADASKVALVRLVEVLTRQSSPCRLLDVQWVTPHLASLGAVAIPRAEYLARLAAALDVPGPEWAAPG